MALSRFYLAAVLFPIAIIPIASCSHSTDTENCSDITAEICEELPKPGENNVWYEYSDSDTAAVFVHGILGDSRGTWLYKEKSAPDQARYWPELLRNDDDFEGVSIFLGGYSTSIDSGTYDAKDAAKELWSALNRKSPMRGGIEKVNRPVIDKKNILFICHSTGGIIVRYMLYHHREAFKNKNVGLVLIASPSYGSQVANTLDYLIDMYHNQLGAQLQFGSEFLEQLDYNFRDMISRRMLPYLAGQEAVENHFIIHNRFLPDDKFVVEKESAARYFESATTLSKTDHFSAVKPSGPRHPAYMFLSDFYIGKFRSVITKRTEEDLNEVVSKVRELKGLFESIDDYPENRREVVRKAEQLARRLEGIPDEDLTLPFQVGKYKEIALCYLMYAESVGEQRQRTNMAQKSLVSIDAALAHLQRLSDLGKLGGVKEKRAVDWMMNNSIRDELFYYKASALAILARNKNAGELPLVRDAWQEIREDYRDRWPPVEGTDLKWAIINMKNLKGIGQDE